MIKKILIAVVLLVVVAAVAMLVSINKYKKQIVAAPLEEVNIETVADGVYEAEQDFKIVSASVKATVNDGKLVDLELVEHSHGGGYGADDIVQRILNKQSVMVDAISGATGSSKVICKAVEVALKKGEGKRVIAGSDSAATTEEDAADQGS